ncbi:hypothetical protein [Limosilactobacillus oris]|uniref:Lipoprotein n=1 Tax=Limosilactobacillus oris DSM 4864 TaxID=1423779 RepID=A0A0R1WMH9_9LACO|nr:hypothetical protein [Limosilactobacillus oris]KRM15436.1 lipoprotein [Limosilactobacillus oris DSM 4864]
MKKLQRLVFSGLLVLTLAFGLAGCGSNHDSSKSSTSKDKVTKVVKKSSNKDKSSHKKSSQSESDENSNSANSNATTNDSESSTSSSSQSSSQKQLGLNDVAVWTDENGITHHVDSDGIDRQTSPNQSGVTYKDWSGSLPSNAQIVKQN